MTPELAESYRVDKTGWAPGPWHAEPDRKEWRHPSGLPCLMVRQDRHGAWCGYVGVPPGHPLHGKGYYEDGTMDLRAHGGLTYADSCRDVVCHVPAAGEPDEVWWFGFDCAHAFDVSPGTDARLRSSHPDLADTIAGEEYRDEAYVTAEVNGLADQLSAIRPAAAA